MIIIWGINQAQSVVVLFLVSAFLAIIGSVPVQWLERKGVPSVVAVSIVVAAMIAALLGTGVVVGASLNEFSRSLPSYQHRTQEMLLRLKAVVAKRGIAISDDAVLAYVNPGALMSWTPTLFAALSGALSNMLLILFTVLFILLETSAFKKKLRSALDSPGAAFPRFAGFVDDMKRYMAIKTLINLLGGVLTAVWLAVLGVDYAILWGVLAFLLHFVPSVGSLVAAVPCRVSCPDSTRRSARPSLRPRAIWRSARSIGNIDRTEDHGTKTWAVDPGGVCIVDLVGKPPRPDRCAPLRAAHHDRQTPL